MYFISQTGEHDCAFTCLNILLANKHKDKNYLFLKHEDRTYSFKNLIDEAKKYNVELVGIKVDDVYELSKCEYLPFIAIITLDNEARHSVVVTKISEKKVTYYDPSLGKKTESFIDFSERCTKNALIATNYTKTPCPIIPSSFIARRDKITLPIFQLLSGISFLLATFFVDKNKSMIISIIFFTLFFIFEILFRDNLIKAMRRMDSNIDKYDSEDLNGKYQNLFITTERYRTKALTNISNIINSILLAVFLIFIILINERVNIIYISISLFLAIVESLIFEPFIDKKMMEVNLGEHDLIASNSYEEYRSITNDTRENAYKIGQYKMIFNYVSIGILLFTAIILMVMSDAISITYVVFYLCVCLFLKLNITKILSYPKLEQEKNNELAKIITYLKERKDN